ncbi:super-infection exclusion protein [Enterobacteria phage vB_EcoS_IME167]|uniref:Super-infection exclusion protein n=3 Tax=Tunavirus JMPW1 TaxID=2049887 RepID=A0A0U2SB29_9CAUD|nr:Cor superinfection exclusion protein [Escherichia phage JMPW1]ALT58252.1 super-infection exclusion protein [Escherichia phage JMPW1]AWD90965.1 super-infection exclusion protein [Enterobacteria phage vB_EcoS_IME167]QPI17721.1 super-infection exclusion protein [Escherichia phage phi2013]
MKKLITIIAAAFILTGCSSMPERTCTAIYESGGAEYSVYVFGSKMRGEEMLLRAGYPFSFNYVSEKNFKSHDCSI